MERGLTFVGGPAELRATHLFRIFSKFLATAGSLFKNQSQQPHFEPAILAVTTSSADQTLANEQKLAPPTVAVAQHGIGHDIRIGTHFRLRRLFARLHSMMAIALYFSGYLQCGRHTMQ
jgi:hypothetical protein